MFFRQIAIKCCFLAAAFPCLSVADPVPTRSENSPGSSPPACDWSHQLVRQYKEEFIQFMVQGIPQVNNLQQRCTNHPAQCVNYDASMAAHCARLQDLGGDCSGWPMTLAALFAWPTTLGTHSFDVQYSNYFFEKVPAPANDTIDWNASQLSEEYPEPGGFIVVYLNSSDFPPSVTPEEYACKQTFNQMGVVSRTNGCVAAGMKARMADGTYKAVEEINRGDKLWNPILRSAATVRGITAGPENIPMVELSVAGRTLVVTQNHPTTLADESYSVKRTSLGGDAVGERAVDPKAVRADELRLGDKLRLEDGTAAPITAIRRIELEGRKLVYNFTLDGDSELSHYFVVEGVVTGDLTLQKKLEQTRGGI